MPRQPIDGDGGGGARSRQDCFAAEVAALKADLLQWIVGLIAGAVVLNALVVVGSIFGRLKLLGH
jgi:hypothetical protein